MTIAFISTLPHIFPHHHTSQVNNICKFSSPSRPSHVLFLHMSQKRPNNLQSLPQRIQTLWQNATPSERSLATLAALGVVAIGGTVVNLLFHISLALVFAFIPLFLVPVLFAFMASASILAMFAFLTAGAGFVFVGTPVFAAAALTKLFFPVAVLAAIAAWTSQKLSSLQTKKPDDPIVQPKDESQQLEDDLYAFDSRLRNTPSSRSPNVANWNLSDVVDELDMTGLGEYRQLFIQERIDGRTLLRLTEQDIQVEFRDSMPLGDRKRLIQLVQQLQRRSSF